MWFLVDVEMSIVCIQSRILFFLGRLRGVSWSCKKKPVARLLRGNPYKIRVLAISLLRFGWCRFMASIAPWHWEKIIWLIYVDVCWCQMMSWLVGAFVYLYICIYIYIFICFCIYIYICFLLGTSWFGCMMIILNAWRVSYSMVWRRKWMW